MDSELPLYVSEIFTASLIIYMLLTTSFAGNAEEEMNEKKRESVKQIPAVDEEVPEGRKSLNYNEMCSINRDSIYTIDETADDKQSYDTGNIDLVTTSALQFS